MHKEKRGSSSVKTGQKRPDPGAGLTGLWKTPCPESLRLGKGQTVCGELPDPNPSGLGRTERSGKSLHRQTGGNSQNGGNSQTGVDYQSGGRNGGNSKTEETPKPEGFSKRRPRNGGLPTWRARGLTPAEARRAAEPPAPRRVREVYGPGTVRPDDAGSRGLLKCLRPLRSTEDPDSRTSSAVRKKYQSYVSCHPATTESAGSPES